MGRTTARLTLNLRRGSSIEPDETAAEAIADLGTREIEFLRSRPLIMRAVHRSGFNVAVRSVAPPQPSSERISHTRLRGSASAEAFAGISVTHAAAPGLVEGSQLYRIGFVSDTEYELWDGPAWLGLGTVDHVLSTARVQLKLERTGDGAPQSGEQYVLEIWPLHEVVSRVQRDLSVVASVRSEGHVRQVLLAVSDPSSLRARELLRQLVLAYVELRPAQRAGSSVSTSHVGAHVTEVVETQLEAPPNARDVAPKSTRGAPAGAPLGETAEMELETIAQRLAARPRRWLPWGIALACTLSAVLAGQIASAVTARDHALRTRAPAVRTPDHVPATPPVARPQPSLQPTVMSLEPAAQAVENAQVANLKSRRAASAQLPSARAAQVGKMSAPGLLQSAETADSKRALERLDRLDERLDTLFAKQKGPARLPENPYSD